MYLDNKYTRIYYALISNARSRNFKSKKEAKSALGYVERHHIIPRSIGGDNSNTNLVYLTAREHFICHWLLIKMVHQENRGKMEMAINMMKSKSAKQHRYSTPITSKVFQKYKALAAMAQSKSIKGKPQSEGHVKKRADAIRGVPHPEERRRAIKEGRAKGKKSSGNTGMRYSNPKISLAKKGIPRKEEHIKSAAEARIGQTWWNNGIIQTRSLTCPGDGFVSGRLAGSLTRDTKIYILVNPEFGNIKMTRADFIKTYQLSVGKVSELLNKKCAQYKGWTLLDIISS
jgi:hypothetical protein